MMALDKNKLNDFLIKVLNDVFETNTFILNQNKKTNQTVQIYSEELKAAVNLNFDMIDENFDFVSDFILKTTEKIEATKQFESVLFIQYIYSGEQYDDFIEDLNDSSQLDIDLWDAFTINSYLSVYERFLYEGKKSVKKLPFYITKNPQIKDVNKSIFKDTFNYLENDFFKQKNQICVLHSAISGVGKTTASYLFAEKNKENFAHIAYVKVFSDFRIDFINAFVDSKLNFKYNITSNILVNYIYLIDTLKEIEGLNLLIIDSIDSIQHIAIIKEIAKATNWKILILSDTKISGFNNVGVKTPDEKDIFDILTKKIALEDAEILARFMEKVDNNLFFSDFVAKQLSYHKKLKATKLISFFDEKDRKVHHLNKYIPQNMNSKDVKILKRILKYIMALYEIQVKNFTSSEKKLLTTLICMPDNEYSFDEIGEILNFSNEETDDFVNDIIELQQSGWITVRNNLISVNSMVRSILHKKFKPDSRTIDELLVFLADNLVLEISHVNYLKYISYVSHLMATITTATEPIIDINENMGEIMNHIGYYEKSKFHYNTAGEILENMLDIKEPTEYDIERLTNLFIEAVDYEKALYYAQNYLEFMIQRYGNENENTANAYKIIALIYKHIEDYNNAIYHIDYALDIYEQLFEADHPARQSAIEIHEDLSEIYKLQQTVDGFRNFIDNFFKEK